MLSRIIFILEKYLLFYTFKIAQMLQPDFTIFPELNTERLYLRMLYKTDGPEILKLRSDEQVMRFIDKERAKTIEDAEVFIDRASIALTANDGITWAIALKEEPGTLIGSVGLWRIIKEHYRAEIGYMLNPVHWGKGIMTEALLKVTEFGFKEMRLHSIEAHINPENVGSAAILTKSGFVKEAHFKEDFYFNGRFRDTAIYSILQRNTDI